MRLDGFAFSPEPRSNGQLPEYDELAEMVAYIKDGREPRDEYFEAIMEGEE